jgi:transglutaminase-like putative cysteine protease
MTALLGLAALPLLVFFELPVSVAIGLLLLLRFAALWQPLLAPSKWLLISLALLGVAVVLASYRELAGQDAGTALLLTMMALKTLEIRTRRDLRVLLLLFGFLLVVAFLFDQSPLLTAYLGILLLGSFALLADLSATSPAAPEPGFPWLGRLKRAGRRALMLTGQALPLAVLLFVLFPRLDAPLWSLGLERDRAKTGVSDSLELGRFGELTRSGAVAFHAYFTEPLPVPAEQLYWRGPVLWQTDGRRWEPGPERLMLQQPPHIEPRGAVLDYAILMEPTEQHWIFPLDLPLEAPPEARRTRDARLLAKDPIQELKRYRLRSALTYRDGSISPRERALALAVPRRMVTPRMQRLIEAWQRQDPSPSALVAQALAHFNQQPFHYTLKPPPLGANPVDDFLFDTRAGYCEHYASSFAILMRLAGVPARLVTGYLGAEFNPLGDHYLIRQSDAHAWAEVWLEDSGWTRVDPTAAIDPSRIDNDAELAELGASAPLRFRVASDSALGQLAQRLRFLVDAADAGWKNWIVGFSSDRQQRLLEQLGLEQLGTYGLVLGLASGGAVLMLLLHTLLGRRHWPDDPVERSYARLSRRLARAGLPRQTGEGPRDYLTRVSHARPDLAPALLNWLRLYLPLRFGARQPPQACKRLMANERRLAIHRHASAPGRA